MIRTISAIRQLLGLSLRESKAAVDMARSTLGTGEGAARTFIEGTNGGRLPLIAIRAMVDAETGNARIRVAAMA